MEEARDLLQEEEEEKNEWTKEVKQKRLEILRAN